MNGIEINLRPVDEVARRAVVLITLARRAAIEDSVARTSDEDDWYGAETDRFELFSWARRELAGELTEVESRILRTEAGSLNPEDEDRCTDALISAEVLCWSLGVIATVPDPSLPSDATMNFMFAWAPEPWHELHRVSRKLGLRDEQAVAQERERRELWYWRSSIDPTEFGSETGLDSVIAETAMEAQNAGLVPVVNNDFAIGGESISALSEDHIAQLEAITQLQLLASNWICGFGADWDAVPLFPE